MSGPGAFQLALQGYRFLETIGRGTYGVVKRARHSATGSYVAIKVLSKSNSSSCRSATREAGLLRSLRHEHIVHLIEVRLRRKHIFLIMELATKGNLLCYVQDKGGLGEAETRRLFRQILSAIQYCHGQRVAHRDLKLDNILLDAHWNAKLADFGLSSRLEEGELVTDFCGTPEYCAPEIFFHKPYDAFKADMWSVGVLLFSMITATLPFQDRHSGQLRNDILSSCHSVLQLTSSSALRELVSWLLSVVAGQRPTADMAWNHKWFGSRRQVTSRQDHVPQVWSVGVPQDTEARHHQMGLDLLPGSRLTKRSPRALFQQPTSKPSGEDMGSLSSANDSLEAGCSSSGHQDSGQQGRGECSLLGSHLLPGPRGLQEPVPRACPGTHKWVLLHLPEGKDGKEEEVKEEESGSTCSQSQDYREEDGGECSPLGPQALLGPQGLQEPLPKVPSGAFKWVLLHLPEEQDKKFLSLGYIPKLIFMTSACLPSAQSAEGCTEAEPTASGPQQSGSKSTSTTTTAAATTGKPTATTIAAKATTIPKSKSATTTNKSIAASTTPSTTTTVKYAATTTTATTAATTSTATTTMAKPKTTVAPAIIPKSATKATEFTATTKSATRTTTSTTSVAAAASTAKPTATTTAAKISTIPKSAAITTKSITAITSKFITTTKSITAITIKFTATTAKPVATITAPPTTTTEVTTTAKSATATTTAEATTNTVTTMTAKSTITTATAKATTTAAAARATTPSTARTAKVMATTAVTAPQPGTRTATSATREEKRGLRGIRRRISRFFLCAFCVLPAPKRSAGLRDRKVAPQWSE